MLSSALRNGRGLHVIRNESRARREWLRQRIMARSVKGLECGQGRTEGDFVHIVKRVKVEKSRGARERKPIVVRLAFFCPILPRKDSLARGYPTVLCLPRCGHAALVVPRGRESKTRIPRAEVTSVDNLPRALTVEERCVRAPIYCSRCMNRRRPRNSIRCRPQDGGNCRLGKYNLYKGVYNPAERKQNRRGIDAPNKFPNKLLKVSSIIYHYPRAAWTPPFPSPRPIFTTTK